MQKFLEDYVKYYLSNTNKKVEDQLVILPSKRSVSALKNEFAIQAESLWLPQIIDIVTFIEDISEVNILEHNETILEFYNIYKSLHKKENVDAFENFYSWASVLVGDFNELDRFLVNTTDFFEHHKALKKINYFGVEKTEMIKSYIAFWEDMPRYYNLFKSYLLENQTAYQGLAYRQAAENIGSYLKNNSQNISFLGFNALNAAEEHIIEECLKKGHTKIGWDIDKSYLEEKQHPANTFIKMYQKKWEAHKDCFIDLKIDVFENEKVIQILSSPKNVGQAKSVADILKKMDSSEIEDTAIVLNDENLLHPILNSIPKSVDQVNITMGVPLKQSPITDFFISLMDYQKSQNDKLDYNFLKALFGHNILSDGIFSEISEILNYFEHHKLKYIDFKRLANLMIDKSEIQQLLNCLNINLKPIAFIGCLEELIETFLNIKDKPYKHYFIAFKNVLSELKKTFELQPDLSIMAFSMLFREKIDSEKLSFKGSKSKGLQIMGMLETRLLDFKNVIITSVNEGILPAGKTDNSYITYNLKKEYGLPTHTEKDAIYAYHFFRLLQRAKNYYLIYDNDQSGFNKGEQSRFITYLQVFKSPKHNLSEHQFSLSTQLKAKDLLEIEKTPEVIDELNSLAKSGFSPTALTTYILNPIQFYKRYVLKVKEPELLEDVINHRDFGTLIHNTVESLYENIGELNKEKIQGFKQKTDGLLKSIFDKIYAKEDYKSGANRIQLEIAKASLMKFYDQELFSLKKSKVEILSIEESVNSTFNTSKHQVILKGKIDRVDRYDNDLRIIDLKTGSVTSSKLSFTDFEDLISDYDYSKAFQILFYALLYSKKHKIDVLKAGIFGFKNLNNGFMPLKYQKNPQIDQVLLKEFEVYLSKLIDEILDPETAFKEKEVNFGS